MLPVVPKVRVGDILYATRNLRNWLQTASLSVSVTHMGNGMRAGKEAIYSPSKKDKYVVCANAGLAFSVFVLNRDMVLFFINPALDKGYGKKSVRPSALLPQPVATSGASGRPKKRSQTAERMSPAIFSTWFVRSSERMPDLRTWPDYAYAIWASLQMNAVSINGDYRLPIQIPRGPENLFLPHMRSQNLGNFGTGKRMKDRATIRSCIQYAIKHGMTRHRHQSDHFHSMLMGHATGPRIEDLGGFRKTLRDSLRNPRIRKNLEDVLSAGVEAGAIKFILEDIKGKKNS